MQAIVASAEEVPSGPMGCLQPSEAPIEDPLLLGDAPDIMLLLLLPLLLSMKEDGVVREGRRHTEGLIQILGDGHIALSAASTEATVLPSPLLR